MTLIDRAKNIIVTPAKEWDVISTETPDTGKIITGYVLPLAGAAAVASFIGFSFFWGGAFYGSAISWGIYQAVTVIVTALLGVFISAFVIDALAPTFKSEKNMPRSVQLVAYAYTPMWIGGLLAIIPMLALVGAIFGLYGLYLLYIGLPKIKKTPVDNQIGYFVVSLLAILVVYLVVGMILSRILMPAFGIGYGMPAINISY